MFRTDTHLQTKCAGYFRILGYAITQLVEALCYKVEGNGFNSHWDFSLNQSFRTMGLGSIQPLTEMTPGLTLRHKCSRSLRMTILPPSCAECLEILWSLNLLLPYRPFQACIGTAFPLSVILSFKLPTSPSFVTYSLKYKRTTSKISNFQENTHTEHI